MAKYIIEGGHKLQGEISISGNKNAVFPCLAASLLTEDEIILKNVPEIVDTQIMLDILISLGAEVSRENGSVKIRAKTIRSHILPKDLMMRLRGSVVLAGSLLGRLGKVEFSHPGGDIIGKRSIDSHLEGFKQLGFSVKNRDLDYWISNKSSSTDQKVFLEEASVTATENLILASALGTGIVILKNCAQEPHIVDLCLMLNKMGAKIEGIGNSTLTIDRVKKLSGTQFTIGPDYIEMATYAIAAVITHGMVEINNCNLKNLEPITTHLGRMGLNFEQSKSDCVKVYAGELKSPVSKLHTNIWPGFPTDLMSAAIVLATQVKGISLMHDWMYESRMFFVDKLISMGANITIADPHRVLVYGPTKLLGRKLETPDIRAGMALLLAALVAKGESSIDKAELIERGYEDVVSKLTSLGANIKRVE